MTALRKHRSDKAQILILWALAIVALGVVASLAVDTGALYVSKARLQNAADASSKAALLARRANRQEGLAETAVREAGTLEATAIAAMNYPGVGTQVAFGVWEGAQFIPVNADVRPDAVWVRTFRDSTTASGPIRTFFAGLVGINAVNQSTSAVARLACPTSVPFGVHEGGLVPPGQTMMMYNKAEPVAPGAFGVIDFDGADHSAEEAKAWTRYGYDGSLPIDPITGYAVLEGTTGFMSSMEDGVNYHVSEGDEVMALVYSDISGQGSNTLFTIIGFVSMVITHEAYGSPGEDAYVAGEVMSELFTLEEMPDFVRSRTHLMLQQ